jgi:signal transduction histidine kinase
MISKLRKQFILINMSCVTVIMAIVLTAFCTASYHQACGDTVSSLQSMLDSSFRAEPPDAKDNNIPRRKPDDKSSPQARTPMFGVMIENGGEAALVKAENITVDDELMDAAVKYVQTRDDEEGIISELNLRYMRRNTMHGEAIVFADRTNETSTLKNTVITSIGVGVGGLIAFFIASLLLSGIALKPVKTAWENQRRFVADASHELKTPITVILANMNILSGNADDTVGSQMKWIQNTREEASRMKVLVEDMLFLAKGDARKNEVSLLPVNISELIIGCVLQFEPVAFERGVSIEENTAPDTVVEGDGVQLKQLFGILLDNACKYADDGTKITVSLTKEASWASVRVNNRGAVIPSEDAAHIFERFYRAEKSRVRKTGGYGLGLSIAQSITQSHGGKISMTSDAENGTTFTVRLPLAK